MSIENIDKNIFNATPKKENLNETSKKEQADLFRETFKEIKKENLNEALKLLNEAIEKKLIDPEHEGDHKQNNLMHAFADKKN